MAIRQTRGLSPKRKGKRNEKKAERDLNRWFRRFGGLIEARYVPGSGAYSHRADLSEDPHYSGDIQIRRTRDNHILDYIEIKVRDPAKRTITIAMMNGNGWRAGRRHLMCRYDHGNWLCSMWPVAWDELQQQHGDDEWEFLDMTASARGIGLTGIADELNDAYEPAVRWGGAFYLNIEDFARLLYAALAAALENEDGNLPRRTQ